MATDGDDPLQELGEVWRQQEPPEISGLRRRVRRADLANGVALAVELAVGAGGATAGIWLLYQGNWITGAAACLFSAFAVAVSIATRWRATDRDTRSVTAALEAARVQANRQYWVAVGGLWVCAAALLFAAVVAFDALGDSPSVDVLAGLVRVQAAAAVFVALGVLMVGSGLVRASRRRADLRQLRARLGAAADDGVETPRDQG